LRAVHPEVFGQPGVKLFFKQPESSYLPECRTQRSIQAQDTFMKIPMEYPAT
jgi:hypothetical protein